jgi:tetratricopeptide (TPR) repeat protein
MSHPKPFAHRITSSATSHKLGETAETKIKMANALMELGRQDEALEVLWSVFSAHSQAGNHAEAAGMQLQIAVVLLTLGRFDEALRLQQDALNSYQRLSNPQGIVVTQYYIATTLKLQGRYDEALQLYEQVLGDLATVEMQNFEPLARASVCEILLEKGEYVLSIGYIWSVWKTLSESGDTGDRYNASQNQLILAQFKRKLGSDLFDSIWDNITQEPQPAWLQQAENGTNQDQTAEIAVLAMREFIHAEDWETSRRVLEKNKTWLFSSEVEGLLERHLAQYRTENDAENLALIEQHRQVLLDARTNGIEAAFSKVCGRKTIRISTSQLRTVTNNTVVALTVAKHRLPEWRNVIVRAMDFSQGIQSVDEIAFNQAILDLLDGKEVHLPETNYYFEAFQDILTNVKKFGETERE